MIKLGSLSEQSKRPIICQVPSLNFEKNCIGWDWVTLGHTQQQYLGIYSWLCAPGLGQQGKIRLRAERTLLGTRRQAEGTIFSEVPASSFLSLPPLSALPCLPHFLSHLKAPVKQFPPL